MSNLIDDSGGYHSYQIPKGLYGEASKIEEEFLEFKDAIQQNNVLMAMLELSDMIGAIEEYIKKYHMTLDDLLIMKNATKRAFECGRRK